MKSGFTLVELSVALALAGMLMASIVGVLIQVKRQTVLTQALSRSQWKESVESLIRQDFLLASSICIRSGDVWLEGDFCRASSDGERNQLIGYGIRPWFVGGQQVLVRMLPGRIEPLVVGPTRFAVERLDQRGVPQPISDRFVAVSPHYIIWIWDDRQAEPAVTLNLVTH